MANSNEKVNLDFSIEKLGNGDEQELKRFYQFFFPHFLSFATNYIAQREICRDIVQEVFMAYWERRADFKDLISLKVFFYHSIRNRCLNELRHLRLREQVEISEADNSLSSTSLLEEYIIREEAAQMVRQQVAKLTPQARKVLQLSLQGKSNQEIAEALSLSINTVKTHKLRAYSLLRLQLRDLYMLIELLAVV